MLRIGIIGCGLIGARRAKVAQDHPSSSVAWVLDSDPARAEPLQAPVVSEPVWAEVDAVVVATPNGIAPPFVKSALRAGKHVLMEKPPGRNVEEATQIFEIAQASTGILKVGFNHRYHPALIRAYQLLQAGRIGKIVSMRARYGHGGRAGYEKEWRGSPELAGGGVLLDQGVHIADLFHWMGGLPERAYGTKQTAVWPLHPLEDSAFALLHYPGGAVGSFHVAWTQWKNMFSLEIFGEKGSLSVDGLGGSYGPESLTVAIRKPEGGVPEMEQFAYPGPDSSWQLEWEDFLAGIAGKPFWGTAADGLAAMRTLSALYRSCASGAPVDV